MVVQPMMSATTLEAIRCAVGLHHLRRRDDLDDAAVWLADRSYGAASVHDRGGRSVRSRLVRTGAGPQPSRVLLALCHGRSGEWICLLLLHGPRSQVVSRQAGHRFGADRGGLWLGRGIFQSDIRVAFIGSTGYQTTFLVTGIVLGFLILCAGQFLKYPPMGFIPAPPAGVQPKIRRHTEQFNSFEMLRTPQVLHAGT